MIRKFQTYASDRSNQTVFWPLCISLAAHLLLMGAFLFSPRWWEPAPSYLPGVIDVQMVDLNQIQASKSSTAEKAGAEAVKQAPVEEPTPKEEAPVSVAQPESKTEPEVSVAPVRKETKSALKYKTFKSQKVLKNTLQRVTRQVDNQTPRPLEDTISRLREKVAKEGSPGPSGGEHAGETKATGKSFGFGRGNQKEIEQIDLYRLEIAYAVQKNWAFAEQLAGSGKQLVASIVFKVMPDGKIDDIFFTDRSGNPYLDDSAYKAIVKSSPVKPFPEGLNRPYIEMGLRFTPEGVR